MARIRTIKPEFFRHERLYELEVETVMPVRVAFAGLWTAADREGRFRWNPRALKLDCLPYDVVDFSAVLDALVGGGFVLKYEIEGAVYGCIPGWKEHQWPNVKEAASKIPPHPTMQAQCKDSARTVPAPEKHRMERKGRERNQETSQEEDDLSFSSSIDESAIVD